MALTLEFGPTVVEAFVVDGERLQVYVNNTRVVGLKEDELVNIDTEEDLFSFISKEGLIKPFKIVSLVNNIFPKKN